MSVFDQVRDYAHRADPYPLYAQLRQAPVARAADGSYVVSRYRQIVELLHDPRLSSARDGSPSSFIGLDPPEHDRLRALTMRHFDLPHEPDLARIVAELVDRLPPAGEVDLVDRFAYPFPVTVICRILGVPVEDEPRFHRWVEALVDALPDAPAEARTELTDYLAGLVAARHRAPTADLLSGLVTDGEMSDEQVVSTATLLLIAGHETTVNLIANGMLTLLRHPDVLDRLRADPDLVYGLVEELLRFEPPVHFLPWRRALDDITVDGTTIPRGAQVTLVLAAGSRDPAHVEDPDRFDPDRRHLEHLGFGGGIHYCFGAPLARLEAQYALLALARRLVNPRLLADPPPYRRSPILRGPRHLPVAYDGVHPDPA